MNQSRSIGMLVNHQEIEHILTSMSDVIRNTAYKVAKDENYTDMFDEDGTLIGYDEESNKILLRDCLNHYVEFSSAYGAVKGTEFTYYLFDTFKLIAAYCMQEQNIISFLTSRFAQACGILSAALLPVVEDLQSSGQSIESIESFATSPENTFYLVRGEDMENQVEDDSDNNDIGRGLTIPILGLY